MNELIRRVCLTWRNIPKISYTALTVLTLVLLIAAESSTEKLASAMLLFLQIPVWMGFYYQAMERESRRNEQSKTS